MTPLEELASQLLLGTERRPARLPPLPPAVAELLAAAGGKEDEAWLLRAAGVLAVCADTGFVAPAAQAPMPAPCPAPETEALPVPALLPILAAIFAEGPEPLRREALRRLGERRLVLPPALLPPALALGRKTPALRPLLAPVLGARGIWLAGRNGDWSWATGITATALDPARWEQGTVEARKEFLAALRRCDPEQARQLLAADFTGLDARERAGLLEGLAIGLSPADEDFLAAALADRSKEVRQLAGQLLAQLPASGYAARMAERMAACLHEERRLLRRVWRLEPPAAFAADWKTDALEEGRAKGESLGERAWWLYQLARALPLAWWSAHTGMAAAQLIDWALAGDWAAALLRAWGEAQRREANAEWAAALLDNATTAKAMDVFALIAGLPPAERQQHWRQRFANPGKASLGALFGRLVRDYADAGELPPALAADALAALSGWLKPPFDRQSGSYELLQALPDFVCLLPPPLLDAALAGWPLGQPEAGALDAHHARLSVLVERRQSLLRLLEP